MFPEYIQSASEQREHPVNTCATFCLDFYCALFAKRKGGRLSVGVAYPEVVVVIVGVQKLDNVAVVTFGQDFDLHHVVLQLFLTFGLDHFGCSQNASLLIAGLMQMTKYSV